MEMVRRGRVNELLAVSCLLLWVIMSRKQENLMALGLCVILILLVIVTTDSAPQWIYQGF